MSPVCGSQTQGGGRSWDDWHREEDAHEAAGPRHFIGGSDARVVMFQDEKALIRLWQEKRGEVWPEGRLLANARG